MNSTDSFSSGDDGGAFAPDPLEAHDGGSVGGAGGGGSQQNASRAESLAAAAAALPHAAAGRPSGNEYEPPAQGLCSCLRFEPYRGRKVCSACRQGDTDPTSLRDVYHMRLPESGDKYAAVKQTFLSKWYSQNRGVAKVERIIAVFNPAVAQRYLAFQKAQVAARNDPFVNERRLFLDAFPRCVCQFADGVGEPCHAADCELCCIIRHGVPRRSHGAAAPGSGLAAYLAYEPGDFTAGADAEAAEQQERELRAKAGPGEVVNPITYRRIGVAVRATLGAVAYRMSHDPTLTAAPDGKDSLLVELPDGKMPEVVLHNADAAVPAYVVVFQTSKMVFG